MVKYAAFLRGIGPGIPNMRNDKLRGVFEELGFKNVQSVISSGNIVFESDVADVSKLESLIEQALPQKLGFASTTVIRSKKQLEQLVATDPFEGLTHGSSSYLLVTFFKQPTKVKFSVPFSVPERPYKLLAASSRELCSTTDNTQQPTTDLMSWLEKQFGKEITSRTWLTVQRVLKKME